MPTDTDTLYQLMKSAVREVLEEMIQNCDFFVQATQAHHLVVSNETRRRARAAASRKETKTARADERNRMLKKHAKEVKSMRDLMSCQDNAGRITETPESLALNSLRKTSLYHRLSRQEKLIADIFPKMLETPALFDILCFWFYQPSRTHSGMPITWDEIQERLGISRRQIRNALHAAEKEDAERFATLKYQREFRARQTDGGESQYLFR